MLVEFATWYGRQMMGLLPSSASGRGARPNGLVVEAERLAGTGPSVRLMLRRRGAETPIGRFTLDQNGLAAARAALPRSALQGRRGLPVILRLPHGALLERTVNLPLAAEPQLERVLHFELDRYTPFAADELFWAAEPRARDRAQGRLQAAIALIPRATLRPLLDALTTIGVQPAVLEGDAGSGMRRLALAAPDLSLARRQNLALIVAGIVCALLGVTAAALPFLRQSWASDTVEARVAALQPRLAEAEALRQRLSAQAAGSDAIAAEQAQVGDPLQAIAALTQILPDDTFLTALVLQKRQVTIEGQSANAARLIGSLSADPVIRNAAFAAPVTRNDTGADLFSIKAEVRP